MLNEITEPLYRGGHDARSRADRITTTSDNTYPNELGLKDFRLMHAKTFLPPNVAPKQLVNEWSPYISFARLKKKSPWNFLLRIQGNKWIGTPSKVGFYSDLFSSDLISDFMIPLFWLSHTVCMPGSNAINISFFIIMVDTFILDQFDKIFTLIHFFHANSMTPLSANL